MEEQGAREDVPSSDPEVGRLLGILARSTGARRILEIGTAIGYGALCLAARRAEARVRDDRQGPGAARHGARGYLERGGVAGRVELVEGAALDVLHRLQGPFDLVYIDAVKTEYRRYLDLVAAQLRVGGVIVCDNLLWRGQVAGRPRTRTATPTPSAPSTAT